MKKLLLIIGILCILLIVGCQIKIEEKEKEVEEIKKITISGIDNIEEISSDVPVDLVISGVRNQITVIKGTKVNSIRVSGVDIVIILPKGSNPEITDSGVRTQIRHY